MKTLIIAAVFTASATTAFAQQRTDFRWEKALAAGSEVSLHNVVGQVTVRPSTTGKVEVIGVNHRNADARLHVEVKETSRGVIVCVVNDEDDWSCDDRGFRSNSRNRGWRGRDDPGSIDLEVAVPMSSVLSAHSVSGDVSVTGLSGDVRAGSVSGDVQLEHIRTATSVSATSVSGSVRVQVEALTGRGDLHFSTVSGDVILELPKALDADLSMSTVSGSIDSDYPLTLNGRMGRNRIAARIGAGGRALEIGTVSGDVRLRAAK
jgi:riboflavin synthase alpha subunit